MANQNKPRSAAEQRPNNKPVYIDSNCRECGTPLFWWISCILCKKIKFGRMSLFALNVEMDYILMFQQGTNSYYMGFTFTCFNISKLRFDLAPVFSQSA